MVGNKFKLKQVMKLLKLFKKTTLSDLTREKVETYIIKCKLVNNEFVITKTNYANKKKVVNALSQINQYSRPIRPFVQILCIDNDFNSVYVFNNCKRRWCKSFKNIDII